MNPATAARRRRWLGPTSALLAGAGAAFAFPPFGFLPGLFGYGLLMRTLDEADERRPLASAFWRGWLAGFTFFFISTCWVAEAFFVDAAAHGWQAPFAVAALAGGMALFWGLAGLTYRAIGVRGPLRVLVFAGAFCLAEWLRGHLFTGFPWDLAGESWRAGSPMSQAAALVGAYGLGWITVAIAAAPALLFDAGPRTSRLAGAGLAAVVFVGVYGYGLARLGAAAPADASAPLVRVVQADVEEAPSYSDAQFRDILGRYLALSARPAAAPPAVVVWPEGAIPASLNDYLARGTWTEAAIARALRAGQVLLTGGFRVSGSPSAPVYYNSLAAVRDDPGGLVVTAVYDKYRLVPFGEYLPMAGVLGPLGVDKLVSVGDGFATGPRPQPIAPAGAPLVQPLICYESLFPDLARPAPATRRPRWIVNVSDDAWFGRTYGPLQHLSLASYRAIEEGLPLVRATPTGVSAVIDAYGRIAPGGWLGQGGEGVIDARLPPALAPTPFARFGELAFAAMLLTSGVAAIIGRMTPRQPDNR